MKKLITFLILLIPLALFGQVPFGDVVVVDTTLGTVSSQTEVFPQKFISQWEAYYCIAPVLLGADSVKATAYLYEAVDPSASAYVAVPGRTASISQKATAYPTYLYDTVSGYKQEIIFTASIDSSATIYTVYAWYRPAKNPPGLETITSTGTAAQTLTDAATVNFVLPYKYNYKYDIEYIVKVTRASGTAAGTIYLDEAGDPSGTAYAPTANQTMSNAAAVNYRFTVRNKGVRHRIRIVGSGTQSCSIVVYTIAKPVII